MFFDVSKMRGAREHVDRTYQAAALDQPGDEFRIVGDVRLVCDLQKDRDQYRLAGRVQARLELDCCRCLEPFTLAVDPTFDLLYLPQSQNTGAGEIPIEHDDLATAFHRDDVIDLGQLLREQMYLALPMKPLCQDTCRGLCPACGTNLNRDTCGCRRTWDDPRLAAIERWRGDHD